VATAAIEIERLTRVYRSRTGLGWAAGEAGEVVALAGLSLTIAPNEVHGLLGPNGAGKTTLTKVLSTVLLPSSGRASVLGRDVVAAPQAVREVIGLVLGGSRGLYPRLSARQNLRYWAALYRLPDKVGRRRTEQLLERLGLLERADERAETFSTGMLQRLHLARGLVGDPQVLLLDEPTSGMDPVAAREFRSLIGELTAEGRTILLTTHDMAEADAVCDRVTLIDRGRLVATETPRALARWVERHERIIVEGATGQILDEVRALPQVTAVTDLGHGAARIETASRQGTAEALRHLVDAGVGSVSTAPPSLEEVYLHLIGERGLKV
jgi:ABC-2 type transport system ATP-binding protein